MASIGMPWPSLTPNQFSRFSLTARLPMPRKAVLVRARQILPGDDDPGVPAGPGGKQPRPSCGHSRTQSRLTFAPGRALRRKKDRSSPSSMGLPLKWVKDVAAAHEWPGPPGLGRHLFKQAGAGEALHADVDGFIGNHAQEGRIGGLGHQHGDQGGQQERQASHGLASKSVHRQGGAAGVSFKLQIPQRSSRRRPGRIPSKGQAVRSQAAERKVFRLRAGIQARGLECGRLQVCGVTLHDPAQRPRQAHAMTLQQLRHLRQRSSRRSRSWSVSPIPPAPRDRGPAGKIH